MAGDAANTQTRVLVSLNYLLAGLWALAGVILLAAGSIILFLPQITCTSGVCSTTSTGLVNPGTAVAVVGLILLGVAGYRHDQVHRMERALPAH